MECMTTSVLDRVVRWNLDLDGDIYGDERERLRWYEGIATAASLQWTAVPVAAAALVWVLGRPAVLPLTVVLLVLVVPMMLCSAYVRGRRVDTVVRRWNRKRMILWLAFTVPMVAFVFGALRAFGADSPTWWGAVAGLAFGGGISGLGPFVRSRRQRHEPPVVADED
jgi:hypothetical protein